GRAERVTRSWIRSDGRRQQTVRPLADVAGDLPRISSGQLRRLPGAPLVSDWRPSRSLGGDGDRGVSAPSKNRPRATRGCSRVLEHDAAAGRDVAAAGGGSTSGPGHGGGVPGGVSSG